MPLRQRHRTVNVIPGDVIYKTEPVALLKTGLVKFKPVHLAQNNQSPQMPERLRARRVRWHSRMLIQSLLQILLFGPLNRLFRRLPNMLFQNFRRRANSNAIPCAYQGIVTPASHVYCRASI